MTVFRDITFLAAGPQVNASFAGLASEHSMSSPEKQTEAASKRMLNKGHRQELVAFKYTRWAEDLSNEDLKIVLWLVGELGNRSDGILECCIRHQDALMQAYGNFPRARVAIQVLSQMVVDRKRFARDEVLKMIHDAIGEMERWPMHESPDGGVEPG